MAKKRKTQKSPRQKAIEKLDDVFSKYIRLRDCAFFSWIVVCPLCWAKIHRKKAQNMHFISRWVLRYRFDEENCHAWCMRCNVILNGNYIAYTRYMQNQYWIEKVDQMINDKSVCSIKTYELEEKIEYYKNAYIKLASVKHLSLK